MKKALHTALSIISLLVLQNTSQAKLIFVSPSGSDNNNATKESPLQTISLGIKLSEPGDSIYLLPGVYTERIDLLNKKGLPDQPICISGYSQTQPAIIDAGATAPSINASKYWITMRDTEWLEVRNLTFRNGWTDPIQLLNSAYISFIGCQFYGGRKVISTHGSGTHHILVDSCFWDQGGEMLWKLLKDDQGTDAWTSFHHGNLAFYNGSLVETDRTGGSFVIRNNTISNAYNAIRMVGTKGYDANIEIYGNTISNIRDNDFEPESYAFNWFIYHNYTHNIHKTMSVDNVSGGSIYYFGNRITSSNDAWAKEICTGFWKVYGDDEQLSFPLYLFNNSFYGNARAFSADEKMRQVKHFNNAYYFTGSRSWDVQKWDRTNEFDYDISNAPWGDALSKNGQEQHGILSVVKYRNGSAFDLRLQNDSPAADAGKVISLPELGWTQPYKGVAPDIGAYEGEHLVSGPAFRFKVPPGTKISNTELPRIVKYEIKSNQLILWFSVELQHSSFGSGTINIKVNNIEVPVKQVTFPSSGYEMVIETSNTLNETIQISFKNLPKGMDGRSMTYWASVIPYYRSK